MADDSASILAEVEREKGAARRIRSDTANCVAIGTPLVAGMNAYAAVIAGQVREAAPTHPPPHTPHSRAISADGQPGRG